MAPRLWRHFRRILPRRTTEVRCVINAATAFVARHLRIWAERPRANHLSARDPAGGDGLRSIARFHPVQQRRGGVEGAGSYSATAVEHTGHHEEAKKAGS